MERSASSDCTPKCCANCARILSWPLSRSSRPEQLSGLLQRAGFEEENDEHAADSNGHQTGAPSPDPAFSGLRMAGS